MGEAMAGIHEKERERQRMGNVKDPRRTHYRPDSRVSAQRVVIAIDVQNLYYGAKDIYGTKVAYQKFLERVLKGRRMLRAIAYIANREGNNQGSFIGLMRGIGCDIRQKQVIERPGGMKCNWDVEIAVDAMAIAHKVDTFVLASGDGDFTYLLRALRMQGVKTEVVAFRANTAHSLIDEADEYLEITKDMLIDNARAWKRKPAQDKSAEEYEDDEEYEEDDEEYEDDGDLYEEPEYDE